MKNTGELRQMLAKAIEDVAGGKMEAAIANDIAKLAGRLNDSFFAEVAVRRALKEGGLPAPKLGTLNIGQEDA